MFTSPPFAASLSGLALAIGLVCGVAWLAWGNERSAASTPADPAEAAFRADNNAAMTRMMNAMSVKPTGDIDHDFALMMIPHHQGAVDMALAQLRYGKNEQLRRIAQEIIVEQMQEIAAMRVAIGEALPSPVPVPTQQQPLAAQADAAAEPMSHHHDLAPHNGDTR
jgi:hypothetical protein